MNREEESQQTAWVRGIRIQAFGKGYVVNDDDEKFYFDTITEACEYADSIAS